MTDNERRILDVLSRTDACSRRELTDRCGMGWATAVKMVSRLEEQGYLVQCVPEGDTSRKNVSGVSPALYALSREHPAAFGIDIEYSHITFSLRNLRGKSLDEHRIPTPGFADEEELADFLVRCLGEMRTRAGALGIVPEGAGIGIPAHLSGRRTISFEAVKEALSARTGMRIEVDNNIRCFAAAVSRFRPTNESIVVVTIRSGIGVGIVIRGNVYQGMHGRAGEIGHFPIDPEGKPCRCGRRGCLETVVNINTFSEAAAHYAASSLLAENAALQPHWQDNPDLQDPVSRLFSRAKHGDPHALDAIRGAAKLLGSALARSLLVLDIRSVLICAAFGPDGDVILEPINQVIRQESYPGFDVILSYDQMNEERYSTGAAYLVLGDFVK